MGKYMALAYMGYRALENANGCCRHTKGLFYFTFVYFNIINLTLASQTTGNVPLDLHNSNIMMF